MDTMTIIYLILAGVSVLACGIVILAWAGKDIYFAIARKLFPKGKEVFVIDSSRHMSRYFKFAKDGVFKINKATYLTNPNKTLGLSDDMIKDVKEKLSMARRRLESRIATFQEKQKFISAQLEAVNREDSGAVQVVEALQLQWQTLENRVQELKGKLEQREQSYYFDRRGAYLYIENDPIPKDLHEWYSEIDSIQLDNVIARVQTKDPRNMAKMEGDIKKIKLIVLGCLLAGAIAAWFAFRSYSAIQQLAKIQGVVIAL
jgi:hypothetical protein